MENKRIIWIDDCKTLTMLLVIIGHCTYYKLVTPYGGINYFDGVDTVDYSFTWTMLAAMVRFIYTFHMPLFMMLGGACFSLSLMKYTSLGMLVKVKAKRLLIPFLYTTILLVLPLKYIGGYYMDSIDVFKDMILGQLLVMGNTHLWFVFSLFWIFLIYYILHHIGVTCKRWFFPILILVSITANYAASRGIELLGVVAALKHLLYFAVGFKCLPWLDSIKWGGKKLLSIS